jgi:hypothetical protein
VETKGSMEVERLAVWRIENGSCHRMLSRALWKKHRSKMIVIDQIKQWNARLILTGEKKPVWWKRILIRVFIGKAAD